MQKISETEYNDVMDSYQSLSEVADMLVGRRTLLELVEIQTAKERVFLLCVTVSKNKAICNIYDTNIGDNFIGNKIKKRRYYRSYTLECALAFMHELTIKATKRWR